MNIQPPINVGLGAGPQGVAFPSTSGGTSPGQLDGMRADWNVRMNVSHENGFVGGAGRILIHNQVADEKREIILYLPAARMDVPGTIDLASATICSSKPGIQAAPGQTLAFRVEAAKAIVTVPTLKLNDWIYIDLTWTGSFVAGGAQFTGGQIKLGDFHPQLAVEVPLENGTPGLGVVVARYEVELGSDPGASVRLDSDEFRRVVSHPSEDGSMTMHEFKSYGKPQIQARLAPPGSVLGPPSIIETQQPVEAAGPVPSLGEDTPQFIR